MCVEPTSKTLPDTNHIVVTHFHSTQQIDSSNVVLTQPPRCTPVCAQEAVEEEEKELSADEMGRKIASQWTTDPDAAGSRQSSAPASDTDDRVSPAAALSRHPFRHKLSRY